MLPGLVDPFPNCYFLVCVFILPLMVIVFKLYLLKRNVVTFYPLTVVLIFYLCSLLGRDIALIMVQICRKESILLLLSCCTVKAMIQTSTSVDWTFLTARSDFSEYGPRVCLRIQLKCFCGWCSILDTCFTLLYNLHLLLAFIALRHYFIYIPWHVVLMSQNLMSLNINFCLSFSTTTTLCYTA